MSPTEASPEYLINQIADRYEVRTADGDHLAEYLTLAAAEWAVRHQLTPVPTSRTSA
ncbi:hypothetical protein [Streptomyces sp. WAC06614]|uniref:hypothetical protein n=1 Tax=Streptomyces sp. WAC06614 TaxID=2487416 RepID=UPI00163CEA51|nr:hypothetical protein [Streptomyces sp. WAC06614]